MDVDRLAATVTKMYSYSVFPTLASESVNWVNLFHQLPCQNIVKTIFSSTMVDIISMG